MDRSGEESAATAAERLGEGGYHAVVQQLFDHSPIAMALAGLDGRLQEVNPAMSTLLLRPVAELRHMSIPDLTFPDDVEVDSALRADVAAGRRGSYRHAVRLVRADGAVLWGDVSVCAVLDEYGSPRRLIVQIADVTAARARHEESVAAEPVVPSVAADPLAGLAGRDTLLSLLGHALRIPAAIGSLAVLHIDIDVDGREEADELLVPALGAHVLDVLAERIVQTVGRSGVVGHMGDGEFVVVIDEAGSTEEVEALAEALRQGLARDVRVESGVQSPAVSIGVAFPGRGVEDPEELLAAADTAMSRAKRAGRNRWVRFDEPTSGELDAVNRLESALGPSSLEGEVTAWFQPVIELATGEVVGLEGLARWSHPQRGILRPAQFMPAAEARGLAARVDEAVLEQACRHVAGTPDDAAFVSVNLSLDFVLAPDLGARVRRALARRGADPSRLVLELTEAVTLRLPVEARRDLEGLDRDGVRIFVDDFGSGYGALAVLEDLPVRGVKLDRSLLTGAEADARQGTLLVGLRHLVDGLGIVGVVEGIETDDELERVRTIGWVLGQGYLLGAPAPLSAV